MPTTGLRFFTVYGPWGRPDMAMQLFTNAILKGEKIKLNNYGNHSRDFTYIDDIVAGLIKVINKPINEIKQHWGNNKITPNSSSAPWRIFNIGGGKIIKLNKFVGLIEKNLNLKAKKELLPLQLGDVKNTHASTSSFKREFKFRPQISIDEGVCNAVSWFREYYKR